MFHPGRDECVHDNFGDLLAHLIFLGGCRIWRALSIVLRTRELGKSRWDFSVQPYPRSFQFPCMQTANRDFERKNLRDFPSACLCEQAQRNSLFSQKMLGHRSRIPLELGFVRRFEREKRPSLANWLGSVDHVSRDAAQSGHWTTRPRLVTIGQILIQSVFL